MTPRRWTSDGPCATPGVGRGFHGKPTTNAGTKVSGRGLCRFDTGNRRRSGLADQASSGTVVYVTIVFIASTIGYVIAGWPLSDAAYMVLLTIYSVGYGEVRPIDTTFLRVWTTMTIVLGCTGMIVLTGALVQVFTLFQFRRLLGLDRMQTEIERLDTHAIVCGFGRIGVQLAKALTDARHPFLIIERDPSKADEARAAGFLTLVGEATHEETLKAAGIERARVLATVLPDDAANVFITLSARNLNPKVQIIARGEAPRPKANCSMPGPTRSCCPPTSVRNGSPN
jgi:voltage-gated potassium channel Kch